MPSSPPPPVPMGLREMLKDYPEHVERLQEALNSVVEKPVKGMPPLEVAIWELEGTLETFVSEAREELRASEESGNPEAIAAGKKKVLLMLHCGKSSAWDIANLMEHFDGKTSGGRHGE